jgi:hypothetical protein
MPEKRYKENKRFKYVVLPKRPLVEALKNKKEKKEKKYSIEYLKAAHKHSIFYKKEIMESELCGCFNCLRTFYPGEIFNWVNKDNPKSATAMCPFCYVDSVIGSKSGYPVNDQDFLEEMYLHWFN